MQPAGDTPPHARARLSFVQPVRIRSGGEALAGLLQPATNRLLAVLLCNPFGQEAIRAQRAMRILSERLGRQSLPSLRFDYHATGDSPGEDGQGRMSRWRHDILRADQLLRKQTGCQQTIWLGLGLGATLALQTTAEVPRTSLPVSLILWDPVLDGRAYLKHLSKMHEYWTRRADATDEALGFRLPMHLRRRIHAIQPETLTLPEGIPIHLVTHPTQPGYDAFMARAGEDIRIEASPQNSSIEWASNTALGNQWVPDQTINDLTALCIKAIP
ncbi:MAG: hypothetical protein Q4D91_08590 [Lautropia sp.]|nr:hypothetical protein [Lautropia sp.]